MTPTTKLEAVNLMLSTIGEAPVNSLPTGLAEGAYAETILADTSRAVQSKGWVWNTNLDYEVTPTTSGEIILPSNVLSIDTQKVHREYGTDIVQRGTKLYDRVKNTYLFEQPLKVTMVVGLEFDEIPEVARRYISLRSARKFYDRYVGWNTATGNTPSYKFTMADEMDAYIELLNTEAEVADYNVFDSYDTYAAIDRTIGTSIFTK